MSDFITNFCENQEQKCTNSQCPCYEGGVCGKTVYTGFFYSPQFNANKCFKNPESLHNVASKTYVVDVNYILNNCPYRAKTATTARSTYEAKQLVCTDLLKQGAQILGCCCKNYYVEERQPVNT